VAAGDERDERTHSALFARIDAHGRRVDELIGTLHKTHADHRSETQVQVEGIRGDVRRLGDSFDSFRDVSLELLGEVRVVKVSNAELKITARSHAEKLKILPQVTATLSEIAPMAKAADERSERHSIELRKAKARREGREEATTEFRTRSDRLWSRLGPILALVVAAIGVAVAVIGILT